MSLNVIAKKQITVELGWKTMVDRVLGIRWCIVAADGTKTHVIQQRGPIEPGVPRRLISVDELRNVGKTSLETSDQLTIMCCACLLPTEKGSV